VSNERGWIQLAKKNGGKVEVHCRYYAVMKWPDGESVVGYAAMAPDEAIDRLDDMLGEDAASEFLEGGGL
jgi:hypothetical protein